MAAIDEHRELNAARSSEIVEGIKRGAGGAATEEHVVHEHHGFAVDVEGHHGGLDVRHAVLVSGLAFLALDRPDLALLEVESALLVDQLEELKVTVSFLSLCVARFQDWGHGLRIGTFGAATAPEHVIGKKLSKVVQNKPTWTLVSLCNKQAAWNIHDWALAQYVPVQYVGQPRLGTSAAVMNEMLDVCQQLVVFEVKGGKRADGIIQKARAKKVSVTLELFSPQEFAAVGLV